MRFSIKWMNKNANSILLLMIKANENIYNVFNTFLMLNCGFDENNALKKKIMLVFQTWINFSVSFNWQSAIFTYLYLDMLFNFSSFLNHILITSSTIDSLLLCYVIFLSKKHILIIG